MRVHRTVLRVEVPGVTGGRAVALAREALEQVAAERPAPGRIASLRVRVDAATAGDRALAARIGRAIRAAVAERARG
jgi:hypothetical protein